MPILTTGAGSYSPVSSGGGAYAGPGDLVPGALVWWGLRAYTLASIGSNCVQIQRLSDNVIQSFVTVAGGGVDTASITTFLTATTGKIVGFYDQTGNGNPISASVASSPAYTASGLGSLPVSTFAGTENLVTVGNLSLSAQPFSLSSVFNCPLGINGQDQGLSGQVATSWTAGVSDVNQVRTYAGSGVTKIAADNTFHAMQNVFNGASSHVYVDGSDTSGAGGSQGLAAQRLFLGQSNFGKYTGKICELGIWSSKAFSTTEMGNLNTNQHAYWGF